MNIKIREFINNRINATKKIEQNLTIFGIFLIIAYPGFYFINYFFIAPEGYENLPLRLSIGFLGGILCLRNYFPQKIKKFLSAYMYFLLIYTLPFFFFFMLFNNPTSNIWQLNTLVGLFLLFLFVSWIDAIILSTIGYIIAYYLFSFTSFNKHFPPDFFNTMIVYISPLVYISLLFKNKEQINQAKQQSLKMQAGAIAHEMRTPLASLQKIAGGLQIHLPTLINTQEIAQEKDKSVDYINKNKLEVLKKSPESLITTARGALTVIDMVLMNLKEDIQDSSSEICSISGCVKNALHEYYFTPREKDLVSVEIKEDFHFIGHSLLLRHVFFNLLKNALYYLKSSGKGNITIWTEKGDKFNRLYFKDTGKGISRKNLPHVFDQFFSRTAHGTGVGLAFCKMVMKKLGGDITCASIEGEFTEFTLTFPVLKGDRASSPQ